MRHANNKRKFGREKNQRNALMCSLARNLVRSNRITTTLAKARELRPYVEKLVTKAKVDTLANRRLIVSRLRGTAETKTLFATLAPKYTSRNGGYTRIIKMPERDTDGAAMAIIEFV
ncbi:MAG: 50S ribosomal protein L17 [Patescibacteria group bacterium]|nr:50S ribosomal protein L17 [Patescibacteria group bacterium]